MKKVIFLLSLFYFSNVLMAQTAIFPAIGDGTETNPYQIETLENLFWIAAPDSIVPDPNQAARWSSHYLQTANIDASPTQNWYYNGSGGFSGWSPIGGYIQFSGSYNGNEHSISNLYLNRSISYLGLFGITTEASVIQNLGLIDVDITANQLCTGAIVGQCFGQIDNCYSGGEINGAGRTGGLVGELWTDGVITNSHTEGTVSGDAGGLVGLNRGTITDSYSSAVLTCTNESAGGFMSYNEGIIDNCYASGSVSGNGAAGGFVYNNWGTITNSYATGNVSAFALSSGGGFAAENGSSISNCYPTGYVSGGAVGGLIGVQNYNGSVENSYATGNVTNVYSWFPMYAGGFIGINYSACTISNCFSRGNVIRDHADDSASLGGFVGKNQQGIITNCFSTGFVAYNGAANPEDKGFAAAVDTTGAYQMSGNYWDIETSFQYTTAGDAEGRFTSEMTSPYAANTFVNWDFDDLWAEDFSYDVNDGYPYLLQNSVSVDEELPIQDTAQLKNYPNPFNPSTTISFSVTQSSAFATLEIYNIKGQKVKTLECSNSFNAAAKELQHSKTVTWNGDDENGKLVSSGIYFARLKVGKTEAKCKMLLLK